MSSPSSVLGKRQRTASSCSSSSSSFLTHDDHQSWTYDVFLSFRGADVRNNFVGHLHANLVRRGINTFTDDGKLERGDEISHALQKAIQESRISIVVFSENYASSKWCLEELVQILHCKESKQQLVYPVFYKVDPADVRHQRGSFGQALAHHESRFKDNIEKVTRWREALTKASDISGLHFIDGSHESKFIDTIGEGISAKLLDRIHLSVAKYPVGIQSRVEDVLKDLRVGEDDVRMVGIWGIGGIGKTTIAKGVYNSIAHNFEGSCFLQNVRERSIGYGGLVELQNSLLSKILMEEKRVNSVDEGITLIKRRLCHKKVLLILDDVSHLNQLNSLVGTSDWFGSGSRIIITTRDKHFLTAHDVDHTYKMKELSHQEALELFKFHAFKEDQRMDDYVHLIDYLALYAQGLPLALKVLGSYLRGRNVDQWKVASYGYAREPKKEIQEILRISYDALDDLTKEIFLHIACFFKGRAKNYVMDILRGCDLNPEYGIEVLAEKALISINEENDIVMHDLLEEMGKEIVHQESPAEPGERSRLWQYEDVYRVFIENTGSDKVRGIMVNRMNDRDEQIHLNSESFSKMKNLQIFVSPRDIFTGDHVNYLSNELRLLDWDCCPLLSFPPSFYPKKLVVLKMHTCQTSTLLEVPKTMQNLKYINMSACDGVRKISGLSMCPDLVELDLSNCTNLVEVGDGSVKNLVRLNLMNCPKLKKFRMVEETRSLKILELGWTGIKNFPSSLSRYFINLEELSLAGCYGLRTVPCSILELQHLKILDLSYCRSLVTFPTNCETKTTKLCYDSLFINLAKCFNLVEILEFPREINGLDTSCCRSLRKISSLSNIVEGKESKMISQMELNPKLCCNTAKEYLAKLKRENILPRDNSEITALLSLFLSFWQSGFLVCFHAASEIPQWLNCRTSSHLEGKGHRRYEVYKFKIEIPGTFKLWESKGGLAFCVHQINTSITDFRLCTIDINGVCITRDLPYDRHWRWYPCGYVQLQYIPFDTIIRGLSKAGIGLLPNTFLVEVVVQYFSHVYTDTGNRSCGLHVVYPEFEEDGGVLVTCA